MRTCEACGREQSELNFGVTGAKRVLRNQCMECVNRLTRERYRARREAAGLPRFVPDLGRADKQCRRCKVIKPISEFHNRCSNGAIVGYTSFCKGCEKARTYEWRASNLTRHAGYQKSYRRRNPQKTAAAVRAWLAENPTYERDRSRRRYADPRERVRVRAATRRWAAAHPNLVAVYSSNYQHQRRANGGRGLTVQEVMDMLSKPCSYCSSKATTLDHVIPVSRGGKHEPENVVPACKSCNSSKGARTPEEWMEARRAHEGVTT